MYHYDDSLKKKEVSIMSDKEINEIIALRYQKWSKISLRIGIVSLVISFIIVAINTGNDTLSLISSIGFVIFISSLVEHYVLKFMCQYMLKRK